MIKGCALASGSSGNCFLIETDSNILIDAGLSSRSIKEHLDAIGKGPEDIDGIFITHEHTDHIRGADLFSRKFSIPVFLNKETFGSCSFRSDEMIKIIEKNPVKIRKTRIIPFEKSHDAANPLSYSVLFENRKASVITDIGYACENVIEHVKGSNLLFVESNHDLEMLENGRYPKYLKQRIRSRVGHLSNYDAALLILAHASGNLKNIVLSHLSQNNNTPELALMTMKSIVEERKDLKSLNILLSRRDSPTELIEV